MKYLIVGGFALFLTILTSRVLIALEVIDLNTFSTQTVEQVAQTRVEKLRQIGEQTYFVFCSSCHGMDGKGNNGKAHNHTKRIAKKSVLEVINNGSNNFTSLYPAGMPANLIEGDDAKEVAQYVASGLKKKKPKAWKICATCHNEDGEGIAYIAPNIKTYSNDLVATILKHGKKGAIGTMPYFGDRLSDMQMRALATYIRSIQK